MTDSTYLFFAGGRCALLGTTVDEVADFDRHFSGKRLSLDQLGLSSDAEDTPVRVLLLRDQATQLGLVVRGPIEARAVAEQDIIPLPPAFFGNSAFSALVRLTEQHFALLLTASNLFSRGGLPSYGRSVAPEVPLDSIL